MNQEHTDRQQTDTHIHTDRYTDTHTHHHRQHTDTHTHTHTTHRQIQTHEMLTHHSDLAVQRCTAAGNGQVVFERRELHSRGDGYLREPHNAQCTTHD